MSQYSWRIVLLAILSLSAGYLSGSYALCFLIGMSAFVVFHFIKLQSLIDWLDKKTDNPPFVEGGYIDEIITKFDSLESHYKYRDEKLSGYLKQFQQATNALPDAIVVLDQQGKILGANRKAGSYLNIYWPQDMNQRISNLLRHPELNEFLKALTDNQLENSLELFLPHNEQLRLEFRIVPFSETQYLLIARDVSRVYNANEMRRDFIANASHELRSPLTVIAGYLEAFQDDNDECPESWIPIIQQMRSQTGRMQTLIEDLLKLSSLESSEVPNNQETVHVAELLSSIYKEAETISGLQNHIFYMESDPELLLLGNQGEIYSAFSNLVFNAVQYTPERGIIRIRWYKSDNGAHLQVSDTGEGIPEEHIGRITERFYRVDKGRSREKGGTGLGLAIVKHIMARHDATLHVESVHGEGSTFRCDFPKHMIVIRDSQDIGITA